MSAETIALDTILKEIQALRHEIGASSIRLSQSMAETIGRTVTLYQPFPNYAASGFYWTTQIGPESVYLRLHTPDGSTLHEWRNPILWVPDKEIFG